MTFHRYVEPETATLPLQEFSLKIPVHPQAALLPRRQYLIQLVVIVGLTTIFLSLMSAYDTVNAGPGPKAFLVLRMAVLVLICSWFLRISGERWRDVGLRRPARWWAIPLLVVAGFFALLFVSSLIRGVVFPALGVAPAEANPLEAIAGDFGEYLFYATLVSWGSAAFGEELLLRGFILDRIVKLIGSWRPPALLLAVVLQAVLFALFHFHQGARVLVAGAAGLIFGLVWLLGGRNLWACILLHGVVDFLTHTDYYFGSVPS